MTVVGFEAYWPSLFLLLLPLLWVAGARSRTNSSQRQTAVLTVLRGCALVGLVLALMRPVWQAGGAEVSVVYALDVSRSVASAFVQSALEFMRKSNVQGHHVT
jgi:FtsH-binding integral membrane protein